jgi:NADH-quinone oxidoreductase subunit C
VTDANDAADRTDATGDSPDATGDSAEADGAKPADVRSTGAEPTPAPSGDRAPGTAEPGVAGVEGEAIDPTTKVSTDPAVEEATEAATGPGTDASATTATATGLEPSGTPSAATPVTTRRGMFGVSGPGDTSGYSGLVTTSTVSVATPRPYGSYFDEVADLLGESLAEVGLGYDSPAGAIEKVVVEHGEVTFHVRREHLVEVCRRLRDEPDLRFELSLGVSGVHYPEDAGRELHAVYHLKSLTHRRRVRLEVSVPDADPHIPSTTGIYPTHDWHERETWDFFGIQFDGHPALTRIHMPDDWPGHPQRKDYPLGGIPVEYKGATVPPPDERRQYT